jgi:hypothetical protein
MRDRVVDPPDEQFDAIRARALLERHARRVVLHVGQTERPLVEALVEKAHPGPVEEQHFDRFATLSEEREERAAARLAACRKTNGNVTFVSSLDVGNVAFATAFKTQATISSS